MEEEYSPEVAIWVNQLYERFGNSFGFLAHLGVVIVLGAAIIGAASLYCVIAKRKSSPKWVEYTALAAGIVSIPYCLFQVIVAAYIVFLETYIGGFYGPGTSPRVYFIPSILVHVFPLIGLVYLNRKVRISCVSLLIPSLVYMMHGPILRQLADAS